MIKIAICDDEERIRQALAALILAEEQEVQVLCFDSGDKLLEYEEAFDIVFLDIGMEGTDGMEAAGRLSRKYPELLIIFVTAYSERVYEAFDVGAFHYLLKPVEEAKFLRVLHQAMDATLRRKEQQPLLIKAGSAWRMIPVEQIYYAESSGRKIFLYTEAERLEFYGRMQELEQRLGRDFFRCHRGFLVHLKYVTGYDTNTVFLKNDAKVYLAKQKYGEFGTVYMEYLRRTIR